MKIYLNNREFPVSPEQIQIRQEGRWKTTALSELGEILLYAPPGLRLVQFESLFPAKYYSFVSADRLLRPAEYVHLLQKAMRSSVPLRLVISGGGAPFSMSAVIRSFRHWEKAGQEGDIYFSIELAEYRPFGAKTISRPSFSETTPVSVPDRPGRPDIPVQYIVKKGDCLWNIAARFLGSGSRYMEIARLNAIPNSNLIFPGQVLRIPS